MILKKIRSSIGGLCSVSGIYSQICNYLTYWLQLRRHSWGRTVPGETGTLAVPQGLKCCNPEGLLKRIGINWWMRVSAALSDRHDKYLAQLAETEPVSSIYPPLVSVQKKNYVADYELMIWIREPQLYGTFVIVWSHLCVPSQLGYNKSLPDSAAAD